MTSSSVAHLRVGPASASRPAAPDRAHDQGQRGAELVADVGEERGLGPVQLGQLLGPPLLGLVGHRAVDQRRGLPGDQAEEGAVAVVQRAPGAGGEDDDADVLLRRSRRCSGSTMASVGAVWPAAGRQVAEPGGHVGRPWTGRPLRSTSRHRPAGRRRPSGAGRPCGQAAGGRAQLVAAGPAQVAPRRTARPPGPAERLRRPAAHASATVRAVPAWAPRSCSAASRRWHRSTRSVVSLTAVNTPRTTPSSSCSGL